METLLEFYKSLSTINPFLAALIPVWFGTISTLMLRNVPARIWEIIRNQSTTTLNLLSTGAGSADMQYFSFLEWFVRRGFTRFSRSLAVESAWAKDADGKVTPGDGVHYFLWRKRLCWLSKSRLEQNGTTSQITHQIRVGMIGRNQKLLEDMVEEFRWRPNADRGHLFYPSNDYTYWSSSHRVSDRRLDSIILNDGVKEELVNTIRWFLDNRQWYYDRGLPYRLTILLEGPPGTGKSSLLRALTGHFKRNLCPINLASSGVDKLPQLLRTVPEDSFILMEDFDDCPAVMTSEWREKSSNDVSEDIVKLFHRFGRSAFLQAIDGVDVLDGQIVFFTTNHIERIDTAVLRDERVNHTFHLGLLQNEAVHRYISYVFAGEHSQTEFVFAPIAGASLQKLYRKHHHSYTDFVAAIPLASSEVVSNLREEAA